MNEYRRGLTPTEKTYSLVEIDLTAPVEDAGSKLMEFDDLSEVSVPQDTGRELFVVYDRNGDEVDP